MRSGLWLLRKPGSVRICENVSLFSKLSDVCVDYLDRMWVGFSLVAELSVLAERLKIRFGTLFSRRA